MRTSIEVTADYALRIWANWMRNNADILALGYPKESCGFSDAGIGAYADLEESLDTQMAIGINAIVDDLPTIQQSAISNEYLSCVFRGRAGVLQNALDSAISTVGRMMIVRGIV